MGKIRQFRGQVDLLSRRAITVELPEFMLRAFERRVEEVNAGATEEEKVNLGHFVELLADGLSLAEIAHLEQDLPGISAAVSRWLDEID